MNEKNQSNRDDLGLSLIETLGATDLSSISEDLVEVALDSILQDGILKDIPVVSTIIGISKSAVSIRDKLLTRKILYFLRGLNSITDDERQKFLNDIGSNTNQRRKVGENLIMLLDRLDDLNKPDMLVKLFRSYLRDEIIYEEFLRFASVVERAYMQDLAGLLEGMSGPSIHSIDLYLERLYHLGLSRIKFDDSVYQKMADGLDNMTLGSISTAASAFHKPIQFELSKDAFLLAQILLGKEIVGIDHIESHRTERKFKESRR